MKGKSLLWIFFALQISVWTCRNGQRPASEKSRVDFVVFSLFPTFSSQHSIGFVYNSLLKKWIFVLALFWWFYTSFSWCERKIGKERIFLVALKKTVWINIAIETFIQGLFIDAIVDRFRDSFENDQITLFPCFTFISKTGIGPPKTGVCFYCKVYYRSITLYFQVHITKL